MNVARAIGWLLLIFSATPSRAGDTLTGGLTNGQLQAIQMVAIARFAGEHNHCPQYHVIEEALLRELADGGVTPEMLDTAEYTNAVVLGMLGPIEKYDKNPSDFCAATWQLLGPKGLYKRQMLEANSN